MTGPQITSGDHDKAAAHHDAMLREIESLRSQLTEAREQRDQAAEALVRAETERDEALGAIAKIAEALGFPGGGLRRAIHALRRERDDALQEAESVGRQLHSSAREVDRLIARLATVTEERDRWRQLAEDRVDWLRKRVRLAMDLLCSPTVPHEPGPDVPGAYGILSHALATTAPQADEQAQVQVETGAETASARVDLVVGLRQRGVPQHPDGPEAAALAEIDRLRTEVKQLRARVREWEAVNADLAAHCDSGDIPIRLGERYSLAVLREIARLRHAVLAVAEDLERYAADPEGLPMSERKLAWTLRQIVGTRSTT